MKTDMEILYTFQDLLNVLYHARKNGYQGFNVILECLDMTKHKGFRRLAIAIAGLRATGLYEIGYEGEKDCMVEPIIISEEFLFQTLYAEPKPPPPSFDSFDIRVIGEPRRRVDINLN